MPISRYALTRQNPLTYGSKLAEDQNNRGLATGQFADVQSAQGATDRNNALRTAQGLQAARGAIARAGDVSPEAAIRAQDQVMASAGAQNLNDQNSVNQLQRQYRNDALGRAGEFENQAQSGANNERNYQTGRGDTEFSQDMTQKAFDSGRFDSAFNQNLATMNFGAGRQDTAFNQGLAKDQFGANRADTAWNQGNTESQQADSRSRFDLSRQDSNSNFDKTFDASREDAATAKGQWGQTFNANQAQQNTQNNQWDQTFGANREDASNANNRFNLTRGDSLAQQGIDNNYRDKVFNAQTGQWEQTFAAGRSDAADNRSRLDLTRGDQNSQFAQNFGANREDAATQKDQWGQTFNAGRNDSIFNQNMQTKNYNAGRQDAANATNRFDITRQDARGDVTYNRNLETTSTDKNNAMDAINTIQDPKAKQAAMNVYLNGGDVKSFITNTLYDSNGGLKSNADGSTSSYASASPGTVAYQAKVDELKSYNKPNAGESSADYQTRIDKMAQTERTQERTTQQAPQVAATTKQSNDTALKTLSDNNGDLRKLDDTQKKSLVASGDIKPFETTNLPVGEAGKALIGKPIKIGSGFYTVVNADTVRSGYSGWPPSPRHTDYTTVKDENGGLSYIVNGKFTDKQPISV